MEKSLTELRIDLQKKVSSFKRNSRLRKEIKSIFKCEPVC